MEKFNLEKESVIEAKESNNLSPEFNEKINEFKESFEKIKGDFKDLAESLVEAKIPYSRNDKYLKDNGRIGVPVDSAVVKQAEELTLYTDKIGGDYENVKELLHDFYELKDRFNYINNRFNIYGYWEGGNKDDAFKKDYPEIASKINSLSNKIPELNILLATIHNKFNALNKFKELKEGLGGRDKWISDIRHVDEKGEFIRSNSIDIGFCNSPEELSKNLDRILKEEVEIKSVSMVENATTLTDEEKERRKEFFRRFAIGAREYLEEFNNLIKNHS